MTSVRAWYLFLHIYHFFMAVFVSSCMGKVDQSRRDVESHPRSRHIISLCIFHLYNGNINISYSQGGSRSPHWASPAWLGLLQFLSPCICLIILTLLLTPPQYFQADTTYFRIMSHVPQSLLSFVKQTSYWLTDAPKVWDKIILRFWYFPSDSWKRKLIDDTLWSLVTCPSI